MPVEIKTDEAYAIEKSHCAFDVSFTDEDDQDLTPDSVTWALTKTDGTSIATGSETPAATVTVLLTGDHLAITEADVEAVNRILTIEAVVDSNLGNDLPLKDQVTFPIKALVAVS